MGEFKSTRPRFPSIFIIPLKKWMEPRFQASLAAVFDLARPAEKMGGIRWPLGLRLVGLTVSIEMTSKNASLSIRKDQSK